MKRVHIVVYRGCWGMSVFAARDFYSIIRLLEQHQQQASSYEIQLISVAGGVVQGGGGSQLHTQGTLAPITHSDLIIVPPIEGSRIAEDTEELQQISQWLAAHIQRKTPILALTTGAKLLAATGLMKDLPLATHWAFLKPLQRQYPQCQFVTQNRFNPDKPIYTTASLSGTYEALLALLQQDKGDKFAQTCAAHLLLTSPQHIPPLLYRYRHHQDSGILALQDHLESHYSQTLRLPQLAQQFGFSERNLKRRMQQATGLSVIQYLQQVRIDKAKKLLLTGNLSVKAIGYQVGYENTSFFIRLFKQREGQTPSEWRRVKGDVI